MIALFAEENVMDILIVLVVGVGLVWWSIRGRRRKKLAGSAQADADQPEKSLLRRLRTRLGNLTTRRTEAEREE